MKAISRRVSRTGFLGIVIAGASGILGCSTAQMGPIVSPFSSLVSPPIEGASERSPAAVAGSIAYVTDFEGSGVRLDDFFKGNSQISMNPNGSFSLVPGTYFVYGGDATGGGLENHRVLDVLSSIKTTFPQNAFIIAGNRDLKNLGLIEASLQPLDPFFAEPLAAEGKVETPALRLLGEMSQWGEDAMIEDYRKEVEKLRADGKAVLDEDIHQRVLEALRENGRIGRHLRSSVLGTRIGNTLFVHGGITAENFGRVPDRPGAVFKHPDLWMHELNRWYRSQLAQFFKTGSAPDLFRYGVLAGQDSVVMARSKDRATGQPALPPLWIREELKKWGVNRIVLGHTPNGHSPTIMRGEGFEVIIADNSAYEHATKLYLEGNRARVISKVANRKGELQPVDFNWAINEESQIGKRLPGNRGLVKAQLANGDWVTYVVGPGFKDVHKHFVSGTVARMQSETPRLSGCGELFGGF